MFNLFPPFGASTAIFNDAPQPWQVGFQDGASPTQEGITELHDSIFFYLVIICFGVLWVLSSVIVNFNSNKSQLVYKYANHGTLIELIWTITPALVLIAIAFPSFKLLYLMDEVISPSMTVKVAGHQWYWSAEYSDFINEDGESIEFDSYMVPETDLEDGQLRLLEVDNRMVVPIDTHIRFIVTGADVIHDFAVPSLGLKIDAIPGRLNQTSVLIEREGVFYGQCSEICGVYHGFMPVAIESVTPEKYLAWIDSQASPLLATATLIKPKMINSQASTDNIDNNESNKYIEWVDTKESIKARKVLESIFSFYAKEKIISNYLNENCKQLLKKPEGHTGITWESVKPESLINNEGVHVIMDKYTPSKFLNKAGVYSVINLDTNDNYIGSATNFRSRWELHYQDMLGNKPSPMHKAILNNGAYNYTFFPVKTTTNYIYDFINKHPDYKLDGPSFRALQIITQYECRLVEQSLIAAMQPNLNVNHDVIFSFNFNPENLVGNIRGSRPLCKNILILKFLLIVFVKQQKL